MAKFTYIDFCGFILLGIFVFTCIVCGLTVVRDYINSDYFVKSSCSYEDIREIGPMKCTACDEYDPTYYVLDKSPKVGCSLAFFPCFQVHVRYYNGNMGVSVVGVIHSSKSQLSQVPRCSHQHCSKNISVNKEEISRYVDSFAEYRRSGDTFTCYYDPENPRRVLSVVQLRWLPVFHCLFWPGVAAIITMSCLCCRLYIWEKIPCRKNRRSKSNHKNNSLDLHLQNGSTFTSDACQPSLRNESPEPSFKSIDVDLDLTDSPRHLRSSATSVYWSISSLASQNNPTSIATSMASFTTALDYINEDEDLSSSNKSLDKTTLSKDGSQSSELNPPLPTHFVSSSPVSQSTTDSAGGSHKQTGSPCNHVICSNNHGVKRQHNKPRTPIGIKRFQNGPKSTLLRDDKSIRQPESTGNAIMQTKKTDLNNSF